MKRKIFLILFIILLVSIIFSAFTLSTIRDGNSCNHKDKSFEGSISICVGLIIDNKDYLLNEISNYFDFDVIVKGPYVLEAIHSIHNIDTINSLTDPSKNIHANCRQFNYFTLTNFSKGECVNIDSSFTVIKRYPLKQKRVGYPLSLIENDIIKGYLDSFVFVKDTLYKGRLIKLLEGKGIDTRVGKDISKIRLYTSKQDKLPFIIMSRTLERKYGSILRCEVLSQNPYFTEFKLKRGLSKEKSEFFKKCIDVCY